VEANETELRELMKAGLAGNAAAYQSLLTRLSRALRAYYKGKLTRSGRSANEAEDLMQETLLAIHSRRHTYHPEQPLAPWVYAIARYKLIDHLRRTRSSLSEVPIEDAFELVAQDDIAGAESAYDLARLLARLPEKMRNAIRQVKLEGLSISEAANRSGISEAAVKVNIHRGLKTVAEMIAREKKR
jgi:RNA polymerase sigma-70 factor, ECF subfamily